MNKQRQAIWDKTGGKCFYCGCELPEKGWQKDHFHPVIRIGEKMAYPELDTMENMVPSCAPCNNFKSSHPVDCYRKFISDQFENTLKYSTGLRQLNRLGLVDMSEKPVVFWFESQGIAMPTVYEIIGVSDEALKLDWVQDKSEHQYYSIRLDDGICTLRHLGEEWIVIYKLWDWDEKGRVKLPNGRVSLVKAQAAEWAIRLGKADE